MPFLVDRQEVRSDTGNARDGSREEDDFPAEGEEYSDEYSGSEYEEPMEGEEFADGVDFDENDVGDTKSTSLHGFIQPSPEVDAHPMTTRVILELILCILAFVGRGLCLNSLGPTMIDLRQLTSTSVEESAAIFVAQSAGFMAGSFVAKPLLRKFNNELVMSVLLLVQAVFTGLIPTTTILAVMCFSFVGQGFAIGVIGIGVTSLCITLGGPKRNGMFLQAVYLGVSIGSVVGPFLAQPFLSREVHNDGKDTIVDLADIENFVVNETYALLPSRLFKAIDNVAHSSQYPAMLNGTSLISLNVSLPRNASIGHYNYTSRHHVTQHVTVAPSELELQIETILRSFYTETNVLYAYVVIGIILSLPCMGFMLLYLNRDTCLDHCNEVEKPSESLSSKNCTTPLFFVVTLLFVQCLIYFGMQDSYSNLLTTFVVLSDLHLHKSRGVYVTSLFWAAVCVGRLNGIWIAKFVSPFKMLLCDVICALAASLVLVSFGDKNEQVLWLFSFLLGISFASINAATVAWAARHVSSNNYLLSLIMVGRCSGLLIVPTAITTLLHACGARTLMYALVAACSTHFACLIGAQTLVRRFGIDGRIYGRRTDITEEVKFVRNEDQRQ